MMLKLVGAVNWFDEALMAGLRAGGWEGLSRAQPLILVYIAAGEHRASQIARNLGVSNQAISQILIELEKKGIVSMRVDPRDGRAKVAKFSKKSRGLREAILRILSEIEGRLAQRIGIRKIKNLQVGLLAEWDAPPQPLASRPPNNRPKNLLSLRNRL
jgi:DNA-binding MarR family transcriptional regulator